MRVWRWRKPEGRDEAGSIGLGKRQDHDGDSAIELPTCDEYVERYLVEYAERCKPSSLHTQTSRLKRFREDFRGRPLNISRAELKEWIHGAGKWSVYGPVPESHIAGVRSLYNHAIYEGDLPLERSPARKLAGRNVGRIHELPPTEAEFEALVRACSSLGSYGVTVRSLLLFAAYTLMRPGEIFALEWRDIDFRAMRIHKMRRVYNGAIDEPKTGRKVIALTPPARDALRPLSHDSHLVFTSPNGGTLSAPTFWDYWNEVQTVAGVRFRFYHATKHYGVHYMWTKMKLSPRAIAAQAGWKLETANQMLAVYGHGEVGALEEVDDAFRRGHDFPGRDVAMRLNTWTPRGNNGRPPRKGERGL